MADLMNNPLDRSQRLRTLLDSGEPLLAPACHDALSARCVEEAGFGVVYMGGFASTASLLGRPDVGLLTEAEMVGNARRIAETVAVPVIADADTGYGNAINVIRTVRDYEAAGVSGIHLEDQTSPKRCGHMANKSVISADEMAGKLRAAAAARTNPDFAIIARTDALAVDGVDAAIDRAKRYADAGADLLWVEAPTSEAELEEIVRKLDGHKLVLNWVEGGLTPMISIERIRQMGFSLVLYPIGSVLTTLAALREHYGSVFANHTPAARMPALPTFKQFTDFVGLEDVLSLSQQFR